MKSSTSTRSARDFFVDPVCGMTVDADTTLGAGHEGRIYHFCSEDCRTRFLAAPERYAKSKSPAKSTPGRSQHDDSPHHRNDRRRSWSDYLPLIILIGLSLAVAAAKQAAYSGSADAHTGMHDFMGIFLVMFSMFKFFNLPGFADGFQMYDLLAKRFRPYAYLYPFLELALGLGYLAAWNLPVVYGATIVIMLFGAAGVLRALRRGLDINCACMGTVLKVPLSTVALTEDIGMAVMAAIMWANF
jgi:YHS domain-containing protein